MNITVIKKEIIKADINKPPYKTKLSSNDVVMPKVYTGCVYFYKNNNNAQNSEHFMPVEKLTQSLSKILNHFYEISGRLVVLDDGNLEVDCSNEGVEFVVAQGDFSLQAFEDAKFSQQSLPDRLIDLSMTDGYLFKVQATYLVDGSVILTTALHHSLADGHGNFHFTQCWAKLCCSQSFVGEIVDFVGTERRALFGLKDIPLKFEHLEYVISSSGVSAERLAKISSVLPELIAHVFHLSKEQLNRLKQAVMAELAPSNKYISSNDALAALLWKHVTTARLMVDNYQSIVDCDQSITKFGMASNGRQRLSPPLSDHYLGNANFYVYAEQDSKNLASYQLYETALAIRQAVDRTCNSEFLLDALNFVEQQANKSQIQSSFNPFLTNNFAVTTWVGFPMYEIDFGYGKPSAVRIPVKAFDGLAILLPAADGGIDVTLGLHKKAMKILMKDTEFLNFCSCIG